MLPAVLDSASQEVQGPIAVVEYSQEDEINGFRP